MRVCIVTPFYNREDLTAQFLKYVDYLREWLVGHELYPIAVVSNPIDKDVVSRHEWTIVEHVNKPLSDKANVGFRTAWAFDPDGVLKLDSDDFPALDYLQDHLDACERLDFAHVRYLWVYDKPTRRCAGKEFSRVGSCRWLSRQALHTCDWEPYMPGLDRCLDGSMDRKMKGLGFDREEVEPDLGRLVTVKSGSNICSNIWPYEEVIMGERDELTREETDAMWRDEFPPELARWMVG